jgi:nucleoside-triphosphatase THEP1
MSGFQKATRKKAKLKLAITGSSGSGKTYGALRLASGMSDKIAYIDTENSSASLYSDRFNFDVLDIAPPYNHEKFVDAIKMAVTGGYEVVVIDSASHFWEGILAYKDALDKRGGNSYTNWNEAGNKFKGILDAVLQSPIHIICCMRSKMDYVLETNEKGKQVPRKIGLAPIMRDNIEYEFTTVFDVTMDHNTKTSKDRTGLFGDSIFQITEDTGKQLLTWLDKGEEAPVVHKWTPEQTAEVKGLFAKLTKEEVDKFQIQYKGQAPSVIIDALNQLAQKG